MSQLSPFVTVRSVPREGYCSGKRCQGDDSHVLTDNNWVATSCSGPQLDIRLHSDPVSTRLSWFSSVASVMPHRKPLRLLRNTLRFTIHQTQPRILTLSLNVPHREWRKTYPCVVFSTTQSCGGTAPRILKIDTLSGQLQKPSLSERTHDKSLGMSVIAPPQPGRLPGGLTTVLTELQPFSTSRKASGSARPATTWYSVQIILVAMPDMTLSHSLIR